MAGRGGSGGRQSRSRRRRARPRSAAWWRYERERYQLRRQGHGGAEQEPDDTGSGTKQRSAFARGSADHACHVQAANAAGKAAGSVDPGQARRHQTQKSRPARAPRKERYRAQQNRYVEAGVAGSRGREKPETAMGLTYRQQWNVRRAAGRLSGRLRRQDYVERIFCEVGTEAVTKGIRSVQCTNRAGEIVRPLRRRSFWRGRPA